MPRGNSVKGIKKYEIEDGEEKKNDRTLLYETEI
jgi:hypothetical protein